MSYKNVVAEKTTITRNVDEIELKLGNLYECLVTISKRSNQINDGMKEELTSNWLNLPLRLIIWKRSLKTESKLRFPDFMKDFKAGGYCCRGIPSDKVYHETRKSLNK